MSAFMTIRIVMKFSTRILSGGKKASRDNKLKQMISQIENKVLVQSLKSLDGFTPNRPSQPTQQKSPQTLTKFCKKWYEFYIFHKVERQS